MTVRQVIVTGSQDGTAANGAARVRLLINDLRLRGPHGVYAEERESGNDFSIDLVLEGDFSRAIETDAVSETVDVDQVAQLVSDVNRQHQYHLIESFADAIGRALLRRFPLLSRVTVKLTKLTLVRLESVRSSSAEVTIDRP